MKRFSIGFFLFLIAGVFAFSQQALTLEGAIAQAADRIEREIGANKKVAVLNFITTSQGLSNYVIEELLDIFTNHKVLDVTERSRLDAILRERNYQLSGEVSDADIRSIGNQLGAAYIVTGQLDYSGIDYRFRLYAIDIERGTRFASTAVTIRSNDRQLVYYLGAIPGAGQETSPEPLITADPVRETSPAPVITTGPVRDKKPFEFSIGGGMSTNYWFYKLTYNYYYSEYLDTSYSNFGVHAGLYAEFFSYILFDASLSYRFVFNEGDWDWNDFMLDFSLFGKYPFQVSQKLSLYPLVGIGYDMMLHRWFYGRDEEEDRDVLASSDSLYFRVGGGLNYDFSEHLRFNARFLYNINLYSSYYEERYEEYSRHGPGLSIRLSYVF
jgi:TolB-like protein